MEEILGGDNAQMGFDRFRRSRRTSPTSIPRQIGPHQTETHQHRNQHYGTGRAFLENTSAHHHIQFLGRPTLGNNNT